MSEIEAGQAVSPGPPCENGNDFHHSRAHGQARQRLPQVFRCSAVATCAVENGAGRRLLLCDECRQTPRFQKNWYEIRFPPVVDANGSAATINPANIPVDMKKRSTPEIGVGGPMVSDDEALELEYLKVRSIETLASESCLNESECIAATGLKEWQLREFLLDPEWAERWHQARQASYQRAADALESSMYKRAKGKSDKLAIFMMPALKPEIYNPKSLQTADPSTVVNIGQLVITPRSEPEPKRIVPIKTVTESKD